MRSYLLLLVFTPLSFFLFAKSDKNIIEHLNKTLKQSPKELVEQAKLALKEDLPLTTKLEVTSILINKLQSEGKFEQANGFNERLFQLADKAQQTKYIALYWLYKSVPESAKKGKEKLEYINQGLQIAKQHKHISVKQKALNFLGAYHSQRNEYPLAETAYLNALRYSVQEKDKAANLNQLATIAKNTNNFSSALTYLEQALEIYNHLQDEEGTANVLYSLGSINNKLGNFQLAAENYLASYQIDKKMGNEFNQIYSSIRLCSTYSYLKEFQIAEQYCNEGRALSIKLKTNNIPWANNTLASTLIGKKEFAKIIPLMRQNIDEFEGKMNPWVHARTYQFLSRALSHLEQHEKAEKALITANYLAKKHKLTAIEESNFSEFAYLYKRASNFKSAFEYLEKHQKNETKNKTNKEAQRIAELKNNIAFLNKERETIAAKNEQLLVEKQLAVTKQRSILWIAVGTATVLGCLMFIWFLTKRRQLDLQQKKLLELHITRKKELLSEVSHELRSPLTGLKLQVELLQLDMEKDPHLSYRQLQNKLNEMDALITDIYQLAKYDEGFERLALNSINAKEKLSDWCYEFEHTVKQSGYSWIAETSFEQNTLIEVDEQKIKQVLSNLINNSLKYTDPSGTIKLTSKLTKAHWLLSVEDSSPAPSESALPMLFERLYREEKSRSRETGGSGLGLSICKCIIDAHEGKIVADKSKLGGLKITIEIPTCPSDMDFS